MNFKIKNKKATFKRIKQNKNSLYRKKAYKSHFMRRKKHNQLRRLSNQAEVHVSDKHNLLLMLPYK